MMDYLLCRTQLWPKMKRQKEDEYAVRKTFYQRLHCEMMRIARLNPSEDWKRILDVASKVQLFGFIYL